MAWACALWSPVTQCGQWEATEAAPEESPVGIPPEWMGQRWEGHHAVHTTGYRECRGFGLVAGELIVSEWVPHPVLEDRPLQDYHVLHTVRCQRGGATPATSAMVATSSFSVVTSPPARM